MASTLTNIEVLAQHEARDNNLDVTAAGVYIANTNKIYRKFCGEFDWPEFYITIALTATLATGTEEYAWAFSGTPIFYRETAVEAESVASSGVYVLLDEPPNEAAWNMFSSGMSGVSKFYRRRDNSGDKIAIRPVPSSTQNGGAVKVTGYIEPTALANGSSTTEFLNASSDDAFAHLLAANWLMHDGNPQYAQAQISDAYQIVKNMFPNIAREQVEQVANG